MLINLIFRFCSCIVVFKIFLTLVINEIYILEGLDNNGQEKLKG